MAATSDHETENLLSLVDEITEDFKNGIAEIQTLKSNSCAEVKHREALELTCSALKQENQRLKNLYIESLTNLSIQLEKRCNSRNLNQELKKLSDETVSKEEEHRREIESMNRNHEAKIKDLESQIRAKSIEKAADEAMIQQVRKDLVLSRNYARDLDLKMEEVHTEVESRYQGEIQDFRECLFAEQQEKDELSRKVKDLEKELLITRSKMAEQQVSSLSDRQVENLKLKMMKLRKENEMLKRQLLSSKENQQ